MLPLNEAEYLYKSNVVDQLSRFAGNGYFVHFSDTSKLGVNPNAFHSDPAGIYFYSLDWLLLNPRFYEDGSQYAVDRKYWTVVKLISDNGITFSKFTNDDLEQLASNNNFMNWEKFKNDISPSETAPRILWDYLFQYRKRKGNKPLAGIDFINDDGMGIIHRREPSQLLVINPRAIEVIARGEQTLHDNHPAYLVDKILKNIQLRYGGEITWYKKRPKLTIDRGYTKLAITYEIDKSQLLFEMNWGRAKKTTTMPIHELQHYMRFSDIIGRIEELFDMVIRFGKAKKDLFFEPHIDPKDVLNHIRTMVESGFTFETEILNERKEIFVTAHRELDFDGVKLTTNVYCRISDDPRWNIRVSVNSYPFAQGISMDRMPTDLISGSSTTVAKLIETRKPSQEQIGWYNQRFYNERDYEEFIGFVSSNCGLVGFASYFDDEVAKYEKLNGEDQKYLLKQIKRVF